MNYSVGCLKDQPDDRDYKFKVANPTVQLPEQVDLKSMFPPIKNQGNLGSCTAFATTAMVEFVRKKQKYADWSPSPLFTYYATRKLSNRIQEDSGASARDALKSTVNFGVVKEEHWPYVISNYAKEPTPEVWNEGLEHQALEYHSLSQTESDILGCLAEGYPFTFGMRIYQSFIDSQTKFIVGGVPRPDKSKEKLIGGHCMIAVGYYKTSDNVTIIVVRNSWGEEFGQQGYVHIPLELILDNTLCFDFWTLRKEEGDNTDIPTTPPTPEEPKKIEVDPRTIDQQKTEKNLFSNPTTWILIGLGILGIIFVISALS